MFPLYMLHRITWWVDKQSFCIKYKIVTRKILGGQKNAFLMARTKPHTEHKSTKKKKIHS